MPKATKLKGSKFTLPWKGPFKIQKIQKLPSKTYIIVFWNQEFNLYKE